ncbi:MAG: hypothetical protein E3J87_01730 [Candidatus Cloacimonadota bacterium]|nr:MAG: hypothetical protein E3J87_01730 [Candidatus Cloacimonadota bacterium]
MLLPALHRLSANLKSERENEYIGGLNKTIDCDGVKIGIFGLTTEYGSILVEKEIEKQFFFEKEKEGAEAIVSLLKEGGCDIIVGLTNIGFIHDSLLADSVSGIDIIIYTIICRTYGNLSSIGMLEINIDEKSRKIIGYKGDNITLFTEQYPPDIEIQKLLEE